MYSETQTAANLSLLPNVIRFHSARINALSIQAHKKSTALRAPFFMRRHYVHVMYRVTHRSDNETAKPGLHRVGFIQIVQDLLEAWIRIILRR